MLATVTQGGSARARRLRGLLVHDLAAPRRIGWLRVASKVGRNDYRTANLQQHGLQPVCMLEIQGSFLPSLVRVRFVAASVLVLTARAGSPRARVRLYS